MKNPEQVFPPPPELWTQQEAGARSHCFSYCHPCIRPSWSGFAIWDALDTNFPPSLAPKAAEVSAEGSWESNPTAGIQSGSGIDTKHQTLPRGKQVWRGYFWSSPGVWAVHVGAVAGRQTHTRSWVREFGITGLSPWLYACKEQS